MIGSSAPRIVSAGAPTFRFFSFSTMIPLWSSPRPSSRAEQIMPLLVFPYVSRAAIAKFPGRTAPGRATTT